MPIQSTKVAIVTGAARGIGRAVALTLAGHRHDVAIVDLLEPELNETAALVESAGVKELPYILDVSDHLGVRATVDDIARHFGRIDVLVNNVDLSPNQL